MPAPALPSDHGAAIAVVINEQLRIPAEVKSLDSFCRWRCSERLPTAARVSYLVGEIWVAWIDLDSYYPDNAWRKKLVSTASSRAQPSVPPKTRTQPAFRVVINEEVCIPAWVVDLASFRRWAHSDEFPKRGRFSYLAGELWVDLSMEQLFSHNQVKGEFAIVLGGLVKAEQSGRYFHDRALVSNPATGLSKEPDGLFVSWEALDGGRVRFIEGAHGGYVELEGAPDMVLEVVSRGSVREDTVLLRGLYWRAGVLEYWLVDARRDPPRFDILRRGPKRYVATRRQAGWLRSAVFGKSFRLTQQTDRRGYPQYTLEVQ